MCERQAASMAEWLVPRSRVLRALSSRGTAFRNRRVVRRRASSSDGAAAAWGCWMRSRSVLAASLSAGSSPADAARSSTFSWWTCAVRSGPLARARRRAAFRNSSRSPCASAGASNLSQTRSRRRETRASWRASASTGAEASARARQRLLLLFKSFRAMRAPSRCVGTWRGCFSGIGRSLRCRRAVLASALGKRGVGGIMAHSHATVGDSLAQSFVASAVVHDGANDRRWPEWESGKNHGCPGVVAGRGRCDPVAGPA